MSSIYFRVIDYLTQWYPILGRVFFNYGEYLILDRVFFYWWW